MDISLYLQFALTINGIPRVYIMYIKLSITTCIVMTLMITFDNRIMARSNESS